MAHQIRHSGHGRWVLTGLIAGQLLLLGYQVRRPDASGIRLIRLWSAELVLPAESLSQHLFGGARTWASNYVFLRGVREQNRRLQSRVAQLELQNQQLLHDVRDLPRLDALLDFRHSYGLATLPARIISRGASVDTQALYVNRGRDSGLHRNMAVITPQGLVGKLSQMFSSSAQVLLITDPDSGVGVVVGNQGIHGILHGLGAGRADIERVLKDEPVQIGDPVVTSGEDQVYPAGIPVGSVASVLPSHDGIFKTLTLRPAADLGRLESVLIVTAALPAPAESQNTDLTAADLRQQHLPGLAQPAAGLGPPGKDQVDISAPTPPPVIPMPPAASGTQPAPPAAKPASTTPPASAKPGSGPGRGL